jgi:glutathione S-transferase
MTSESTQEPIRLFTYPNSPFGAKVYWALQFKRVGFELIYVNPFTTKEISFTKQKVIPVLAIGDAWVQDSTENCLRLDELFPEHPFAGQPGEQRDAIVAADQWVTENIVALHFRAIIDREGGATTKRNALRMANVILPATESMPELLKKIIIPFWPLLLRTAGFVRRAAHKLDKNKDVSTLHAQVLKDFEDRIRETGFIAQTNEPSFADVGAFAEVAFCTTHGFEGTLNTTSSPEVAAWYDRMKKCFPDDPSPALFPQWPPIGFSA